MNPWTFALLAAAVHRTVHLILDDHLTAPLRDRIWQRWPYGNDPTSTDPAGAGVAVRSWWGRRLADRTRSLRASAARLWLDSWGDRIAARDSNRPGVTRIGWLFTCPWCMSVWAAAAWWAAWRLWPAVTAQAAAIPALSTVCGLVYDRDR